MNKEEKIKVYRVLKDHLTIGCCHTLTYHPEELYAYLGCTPFYGNIRHGFANNIGYRQIEEGKYFFVFPEDALLCSSALLNNDCYTAKIVEYEFPLGDVFYNIGYGEYENRSIHHQWVTEFTVGKSVFTGEKLSSKSIDDELKRKITEKSYDEINDLLGNNKMKEYFPKDDYCFEKLEKRFNFRSEKFINDEANLIKSNEMTGRIWTIINFGYDKSNVKDVNIEHLANNGLVLDCSNDFKNFRRDVGYLFGCDGSSSGPDKAKKLIMTYYNNKEY